MSWYQSLIAVLFPEYCVGCGSTGALLCTQCSDLPQAHMPEETYIISIYAYSDRRVRKLIRKCKYKGARHGVQIFAPSMAQALDEYIGEEKNFLTSTILLVPVPLTRSRFRLRGYNQAELLARYIARESTVDVCVETEILKKICDTKPQAEIKNKQERLRNLSNCFRAERGKYSGRELVVLIDDVSTTGATLRACKKALQEKGFKKVIALTAAH